MSHTPVLQSKIIPPIPTVNIYAQIFLYKKNENV